MQKVVMLVDGILAKTEFGDRKQTLSNMRHGLWQKMHRMIHMTPIKVSTMLQGADNHVPAVRKWFTLHNSTLVLSLLFIV
jgi:hypothetical protein